jgi:hypothetical protein
MAEDFYKPGQAPLGPEPDPPDAPLTAGVKWLTRFLLLASMVFAWKEYLSFAVAEGQMVNAYQTASLPPVTEFVRNYWKVLFAIPFVSSILGILFLNRGPRLDHGLLVAGVVILVNFLHAAVAQIAREAPAAALSVEIKI